MTIDQLATELQVDREEIIAMERNPGYRLLPATLGRLSEFYGIPQRGLAALAGALREAPQVVREEAARYAAQSESLAKLSREERRLLNRFVRFLKKET
jgi:hypothetical protein